LIHGATGARHHTEASLTIRIAFCRTFRVGVLGSSLGWGGRFWVVELVGIVLVVGICVAFDGALRWVG
jgi:hypothetical protein